MVSAVLLGRAHGTVLSSQRFVTIAPIRECSVEFGRFQLECYLAISFSAHVAVPSHVLLQQVGDESVLLNLKTEIYFGLDSVGTRMWEALTKSATVDAAYRQLLETYDVDPNRLRQDMEALIENLLHNGLLETAGG